MNPILLSYAARRVDRFQTAGVEMLDDRLLHDIGLERRGNLVTTMEGRPVRHLDNGIGANIVAFMATIITSGGFRPA
jgi:hypothetical protein